jgi:multidrug efflux pump subunit AcrA (membrane-fusion protein)
MLKSGQFARVKTNIGAAQQQIVVPTSAISEIQGVYSVWVIDSDSTAHYRQVAIGDVVDGNRRVVLSGLKSGEKVVTNGGSKLSNGQKVKLL